MKLRTRVWSMLLAVVLMLSAVPMNAFAKSDIKYGVAWINGNNLRLRSKATTGSRVLDSAPKGDIAVVISQSGDWCKVIYDNQEGYMHADYLNVKTKENVELGYGEVDGNKVNLRSGPGTSYSAVARGNSGDKAYVVGINNGWYKVIFDSKICYIRSDYLTLTEIPYENAASEKEPLFFRDGDSTGVAVSADALKKPGEVKPEKPEAPEKDPVVQDKPDSSDEPSAVTGQKIVDTAKKYLGTPYVWGGVSPSGFDCSGFVYYVYNSLGIKLSRMQVDMYQKGTKVEKADLQPGDIVFFQNTYKAGISHCGIYVGDGKFIHSTTSGDVVSYSDLNSAYYVKHYYGACRYV